MKWIVTIAALNLEHGGPPRTVPALCRAMAKQGAEVELITISEDREMGAFTDASFKTTVVPTRASRYQPFLWRRPFLEALAGALKSGTRNVMYDVGLWLPANHFTARFAARNNIPLIISPRGMLSARALQVARWRKKLAWQLYQRRDLRTARILHATSASEADDLRHVGLKQPIALIPNGTIMPPEASGKSRAPSDVRTLLFLSRLHPIKGLPELVKAWAKVQSKEWRVVIAGPDEDGHKREIELLIDQSGVRPFFEFVGRVTDAEKWDLLARADLFVLPSHSESFGQVIAEALAAGLPVITTKATPWREIEENNAGWWVAPEVDALAMALRSATEQPAAELQQMGARGRELIARKYTWDAAGEQLLRVGEWLVDGGERPHCLV